MDGQYVERMGHDRCVDVGNVSNAWCATDRPRVDGHLNHRYDAEQCDGALEDQDQDEAEVEVEVCDYHSYNCWSAISFVCV